MTFKTISDFGLDVLEAFKNLTTVLTLNINELQGLYVDNKAVQWIFKIINASNPLARTLSEYSIMELMFTSGVAIFLVVMIIKWVIGIIT